MWYYLIIFQMTQCLSCWKHLNSFLRCHLVVNQLLAYYDFETFEIIFYPYTLSQSDYMDRKKCYNQIVSSLSVSSKEIEWVIEFIFSLSHLLHYYDTNYYNRYTESINLLQEWWVQSLYLIIDLDIFFISRPVTLYWAIQNIVILHYYFSFVSIFIMLRPSQ